MTLTSSVQSTNHIRVTVRCLPVKSIQTRLKSIDIYHRFMHFVILFYGIVRSELKCQIFIGPTKEPNVHVARESKSAGRPQAAFVGSIDVRSQPQNSDGAKLTRRGSLVLTTHHQYVPYERLSALLRPNGLSIRPRGPDLKRGHSPFGCPLARARPPECGAPWIRRSFENGRRRPIRHDRARNRTAEILSARRLVAAAPISACPSNGPSSLTYA